MDEETEPKQPSNLPKLLLLLVLVAIIFIYWRQRGQHVGDLSTAQLSSQEAADRASGSYDPDDILVDLKDDATPAQVAALEAKYGVDLVLVSDESKDEQFYRAHVDASREASVLAQLKKDPEVEIAEPDAIYSLPADEDSADQEALALTDSDVTEPGFPNDPMYAKQWHMRQIGMPEAWKMADGNGVIVAVLDTGVGYEDYKKFILLPDLKGLKFVKPYNFVGNNTHANDDHGHGSHVTGSIAQVTNNGIGVTGVARNVKIMPLKVLSAGGSGSVAGIADAIRYAADNGAKVINMSLGGSMPSDVLKKAVKYAYDKGVTIVCAAGNEGKGKVGYPAAYPGAIAISATQEDEGITFYSNYGDAIDLAAPGGNTRDSKGGRGNVDGGVLQNTIAPGKPGVSEYTAYMGTSMASPHAAGVAALVVGEGVTKPDAVEKILEDSARKPANQKYERSKYGAGILDAPAAIRAAKSKDAGGELGVGLLMAGAVAASLRRRRIPVGAGFIGGVVIGACGLFFLPAISTSLASAPVLSMLSHGMPSWDLSILGPASHGNALFFSAAIPFALLVVGFGTRFRGALAGLSVGVAAHLAVCIVAAPFALSLGMGLWLAANAIACLGLARLALRR
ncbi:MAG TPA: S8 family serine peptidase [Kofleriaceae bacterium]